MSQTNNTNTGDGNNRNNNAGRGGWGQGGSGGPGCGGRGNDRGNNTIARDLLEGKMKEGPLFKLTITKGGQRTTQYKKIIDALPVLCADKGFRYVDEIICTDTELVKATFVPSYTNEKLWSTDHEVYVKVVDTSATVGNDGLHSTKKILTKKTIITNSNLQKKLLSKYDQESKFNSQEWAKLKADKMAVMTIIYG